MIDRSVLLHIGYPQAGSSWLQGFVFGNPETGLEWLGKGRRNHPVRRLVTDDALSFDAAAMRAKFDPFLEAIWEAGYGPVVSFERYVGHPFGGGYDSKEIADRLAAVFPDGRVLVVIREQRSMLASAYKNYVRAGGPASIRQFLKPARSKQVRIRLFDFSFYEYDRLLRYYTTLFGSGSTLVLPFEQFVREPAEFVRRILAFAGRDEGSKVIDRLPFDVRKNTAEPALRIALQRQIFRLSWRSEFNQSPLLDGARGRGLARGVGRLAKTVPLPQQLVDRAERSLRETIDEVVGNRYAESNRATAALAGLDLADYGWPV